MSRPIPPRRPVVEPVETRPRLLRPNRQARIAGVMAAALVISWGAPAANAYWQTLNSNNGGARADSILGVAAPTASASSGAASVSWLASTTAAGRPVSGYTVARYSSATGGTKVAAGGACGGTIATLTCNEAALPVGTWYYTVTPVLAAWAGPESARSGAVVVADTTRPDPPVIIAPAYVNSVNVSDVPVRGTAEPSSSVTVTVSGSGSLPVSRTVTATGSGDWTTADFNLTAFSPGVITYTATAKDAAGNVSDSGTATSTKEVTVPTVSAVTLGNGGTTGVMDAGDTVTLKFSEALDPSTICSSWITPGNQLANGANQVVVTVGADDVLSVTVDGCATLRVGSVGLVGNYAGTGGLIFKGTDAGASSLAWNVTAREITITLGSRTGTALNVNGNVKPTYTPFAGLADAAGNPVPITPVAGGNSRF